MCFGCWDEERRPQIDTPVVREVATLITSTDAYGPLHIIVEDWNVDDDSLDFCQKLDDDPKPNQDELKLLALLAAMSVPERYSALALAEGFWR